VEDQFVLRLLQIPMNQVSIGLGRSQHNRAQVACPKAGGLPGCQLFPLKRPGGEARAMWCMQPCSQEKILLQSNGLQ